MSPSCSTWMLVITSYSIHYTKLYELTRLIDHQDMSSAVDQRWITVATTARCRTYDPVLIIDNLEKLISYNFV